MIGYSQSLQWSLLFVYFALFKLDGWFFCFRSCCARLPLPPRTFTLYLAPATPPPPHHHHPFPHPQFAWHDGVWDSFILFLAGMDCFWTFLFPFARHVCLCLVGFLPFVAPCLVCTLLCVCTSLLFSWVDWGLLYCFAFVSTVVVVASSILVTFIIPPSYYYSPIIILVCGHVCVCSLPVADSLAHLLSLPTPTAPCTFSVFLGSWLVVLVGLDIVLCCSHLTFLVVDVLNNSLYVALVWCLYSDYNLDYTYIIDY